MQATKQSLIDGLKTAVENEIKDRLIALQGEILHKASVEFEKRAREVIGTVAISAQNYFTVERNGYDLVIRVKLEVPCQPTNS